MANDYPLYVTLAELHRRGMCSKSYRKLMRSIDYDKRCVPKDVIIPLELILETNGPCDVSWCLDKLFEGGVISCDELMAARKLSPGRGIYPSFIIGLTKAEATVHLRKWLCGRRRR